MTAYQNITRPGNMRRDAIQNPETGHTIVVGDEVTVGKSKNVWLVTDAKYGRVELHRQTAGRVMFRWFDGDTLTVVESIEKLDAEWARENFQKVTTPDTRVVFRADFSEELRGLVFLTGQTFTDNTRDASRTGVFLRLESDPTKTRTGYVTDLVAK